MVSLQNDCLLLLRLRFEIVAESQGRTEMMKTKKQAKSDSKGSFVT